MGALAVGGVNRALTLWTGFVLAFAALSYSLRFTEGKPPKDLLYKWVTVEGNLIQYGIIAAIVYGIAGVAGSRREVLALRRPTSWRTAARIGLGIGIFMIVLTRLLGPILQPGREQGITPDFWEPKHAAAYIANGIVIAVVAPVVEELTFRGLGYSLLVRYGKWAAIVLTGLAFGLAHGLVEALPFLTAFGIGLAYLRSRVRSVYPGMIVHGLFNAVALTVSVAGEPQVDILRACAAAWFALSPF
jgi:membrane protease YdiL (CAAX protease family)